MKEELKGLIGALPASEGELRRRSRFHQGWWRAFVLAEPAGPYPGRKGETICNTLADGRAGLGNFLSPRIVEAVFATVDEREEAQTGMLEQDRLFNNLLSSQPLCFNFFGELKMDTAFALALLHRFWPALTAVERVLFEFAPAAKYTNDNSAFDVAVEVRAGSRRGLIGLECKYTDSFSPKPHDRPAYRRLFAQSKGAMFAADYEDFVASRFNQLFRNQLLAAALLQHEEYDFVVTGLFCHGDDAGALQTGRAFQRMLAQGADAFRIITYQAFIEAMQRLDLRWPRRELSMMLWARYCGNVLSVRAYA